MRAGDRDWPGGEGLRRRCCGTGNLATATTVMIVTIDTITTVNTTPVAATAATPSATVIATTITITITAADTNATVASVIRLRNQYPATTGQESRPCQGDECERTEADKRLSDCGMPREPRSAGMPRNDAC